MVRISKSNINIVTTIPPSQTWLIKNFLPIIGEAGWKEPVTLHEWPVKNCRHCRYANLFSGIQVQKIAKKKLRKSQNEKLQKKPEIALSNSPPRASGLGPPPTGPATPDPWYFQVKKKPGHNEVKIKVGPRYTVMPWPGSQSSRRSFSQSQGNAGQNPCFNSGLNQGKLACWLLVRGQVSLCQSPTFICRYFCRFPMLACSHPYMFLTASLTFFFTFG